MLGPAVRLALGAGELVPAAAGLPGRLLALLWPALALAAAALLVLRGLRRGRAGPGPRRHRRAAGDAQEEEEKEEDEDGDGDGPAGAGGRAAGALPARRAEEQRRPAQVRVHSVLSRHGRKKLPYVLLLRMKNLFPLLMKPVPVNGQLTTSANFREKKLLKPKKKRKAQCSDKELPKDLLSVEKDKLQEEEGVWQTKISSREKRHLRKERLKQKDPSRASLRSSAVEPAFDWDEKGAVWPLTEDTGCSGRGALIAKAECGTTLKAPGALREESVPSQSEEDVFSNVGTWDIAEVKSCPVTFGTLSEFSRELDNMKHKSSEDSPSRCSWHLSSTFLPADDVWQGQDDPSAIDPDSDWKAPTEEWGNWTGDEEHQTGAEKEKDLPKSKAGIHFCLSGLESKTQRKKKKIEVREAKGGAGLRHPQQGLETRTEGGPRDLVSTKHRSDAVCASFKKSLDVANNSPNNGVPGKKERRKRKKMKKET